MVKREQQSLSLDDSKKSISGSFEESIPDDSPSFLVASNEISIGETIIMSCNDF